MQWLTLIFALETGLLPKTGLGIFENQELIAQYNEPDYSTYLLLESEMLLWETIFFGLSIDYRQIMIKLERWYPHRIVYGIWGGLRWHGLEIGIWHICDHNVVINPIKEVNRSMLWGSETHIYARYELRASFQ